MYRFITAANNPRPSLGDYSKYYKWDKVVDASNLDKFDRDLQDIGKEYGYDFLGYVSAKARYSNKLGDDYSQLLAYSDNGELLLCDVVHGEMYEISIDEIEDYVDF